ncbi:MAG: 1-acyl-sn-glycerol-3-phosphate acyltransferase [Spirochaetaceae bacterium]|jgi:1-acyl-sn-glycerol-3-phosphate acyltransferase|nr:1-acyl-sn-glycerol-3-phosphate acyltransferase [Spirochaetaceae bacterium]
MRYKRGGALIDNSFLFRLCSTLTFYPVWHIAQLVNIILYSTSYEDRGKLRKYKGRAILVSNHTTLLDPVLVSGAVMPERIWHTLLEKTVEAPFLGTFTRLLGGLPLPPGGSGIEKIIASSEAIFKHRRFIHFYPEGECYIYNQKIMPFKTGAFFVAARLGLPVFPLLTVFSDGALKPKTPFARKFPKERLVVLDPVHPSSYIKYNDDGSIALPSVKEFASAVCDIMRSEICRRHELNGRDGTQSYFRGRMPRIKGVN